MRVEVIHNTFEEGPLKKTVHRFTTAPHSIRDEVLKYLQSFPRTESNDTAVEPNQKLVESVTDKISRPASISSKASKSSKKGKAMIATLPEASGSQPPSIVADDENDEWEDEPVSEASDPDPDSGSYTMPPKKKHHAAKGRRRESFRRSALARHAIAVHSPSLSDSGDAAGSEATAIPPPTPLRKLSLGQHPIHTRGASDSILVPPGDPSGLPRPTLSPRGSGLGLRNRFDRLKNDEIGSSSSRAHTRENSPARVIRFAEQAPPDRTPAQTAPPSDDEHTHPSVAPGNTQSRFQ